MESLKKFFDLSWQEKKLFLESVFFLFLAKGVLLVFPFKTCINWMPEIINEKPVDNKLLEQIKTNIARTNRLAFWKNQCLVKSMAARWMLQRRDISSQLAFGMMLDESKKPIAHAWIKVKEFEIVAKDQDYVELYTI
ncbi:lasso peptide biosynthesis B2 protein [Cyclobacteriaceae bacterium YHN15]|nr:lasso peptide biosynthesis B2 protein [Cyclobacteriaceae bacterium YHN15]